MAEKLTYAKAGGPPDDWRMWRVFNSVTGQEVRDVREVDTAAGWCIKLSVDALGRPVLAEDHFTYERVTGAFELRRVDAQPETLGPRKVYGE